MSGWRISWAPDGRRLVLGDVVDGNRILVVVDTQTHQVTRIGAADLDGFDPAWSPDGRHIAFVRGHADVAQRGLYVMDPDGSHYRRLSSIPSRGLGFDEPVWSPTSDWLAVAVEAGGADPFQKDIWVIGLDESSEIDISYDPADEGRPGWSSDGKRLAWIRRRSSGPDRFEIVVSAADGTGQTVLSPLVGPAPAAWSPDGASILAVDPGVGSGGADQIVSIDVRSGAVVELVEGHADGAGSWQRPTP